MKNLITYLKALWSWVSGSQRKKIGVTLGEATIEHPFSTYSAPFGTCWQPSGKLHSVVRCAAMLVMLLTLGSGNVWGEVWVKVTAAPTSWAGEYLLVYESSSTAGVAWTGVDAQNCNTSVTISSGTISTKPASAVSLTVAAITGGYSIKVNGGTNNGKYLGRSGNSNGMDFGNSAVVNTFAYDGSNSCVTITSAGGAIMRYNSNSNNYRFRYFKSSTYTSQQPVQLYRKAYKVTYDKNGGTGTMTDSNSPYAPNATVTVKSNSFTAPTGQTFNGWNTASGGGGTSYAAGATFTITSDITLYAQWVSAGTSVTLSKAGETNGTFTLSTSSVTTTSSAQTVTVTCTPDAGYYVSAISATNPATCPSDITYGGSNNSRTVTYPTGANGLSTISVTFSPIWYLKGDFNSWGTTDPLTDITSNVATVTKSLSKTTAYEFKVYNAQTSTWYGNNGKIIDDISGWTFSTSEDNCQVFATVADDYTFNFNITNQQMEVVYPDMTHPNDAYVYLTNWWDCYVHYWYTDGGGDHALIDWGYDTQLSRHEEICETDYWCVPILDGYPKLAMKDNAGDPSNTTGDQTTASNAGKYITHNGVSWGWHEFTTYTISYDKGTGTGGSMSSHTDLCPGSNQTLSANAFTKDHYHFTGWVANVDVKIGGSTVIAGTLITGGSTIQEIRSNITLTAQWEINSNTLTWNWGGGSTTSTTYTLYPATSGSVNYGASITYPANGTMSKTGYNFSSWSSSATSMPDNALTITASWTAKTYSNTLDREGGTTGSESVTTTYNSSTLTGYTAPGKTGYTFGGYWSGDDGTGTEVIGANGALKASVTISSVAWTNSSSQWVKDGAVTMYAKWTAKDYTVTLNDGSGSGGDGTVYVTYNSNTNISDVAKPTYTGYDFRGYYTAAGGTGTKVINGNGEWIRGTAYVDASGNWVYDGSPTLYAYYTAYEYENYRTNCSDMYDIVLDDGLVATTNNGSAKVADNGTTLTSIVAPTKNGYDIEGYYTTSGLATKIATNEGALQPSVSTWTDGDGKWVLETGATFYTKWTAHEYTITYEGLEGASNTNPTSYTIETATIVLANPGSRTGYTFTGWTCGGDPISNITIGSTGDKTITAMWSINTPNLAVSAADHVVITATPASELAIAEGANRNVNYNKTITLNCTPDDHWSLAWDVYKTGESSTKVALTGDGDGATFAMPDYAVTVTAVMTEATYHTATFKNNGAVIAGYDAVKTYDGERPSAPTLTDVTDACDKTDCNKFYGWIAEDGIWNKTINSVAGKTIYRNASSIPVVDGADVVYHAVWAKGDPAPEAPHTTIAYWANQSLTASTGVSATTGSGTMTSNTTLNNDGTNTHWNGSGGGAQIDISGLDLSEYSGIHISFYARSSQAVSITVSYSTNGSDYTTVGSTASLTGNEVGYTIDGIPNTATYLRLKHNTTTGSIYFGTVTIAATLSGTYSFTKLTAENTVGWAGADWDGTYIITNRQPTIQALDGNGISATGLVTVTPSEGVITSDMNKAFAVEYSAGNGYAVRAVGADQYLWWANNSVASYVDITDHYCSEFALETIIANGKYLSYNTSGSKMGFYNGKQTDWPDLYKILPTYSKFRITCCDKKITIGTVTKTGSASSTVTFESGGDAVAVGETVETCQGATITATVTPVNGYQCTALTFSRADEEDITIDPAISVPFTGATDFELTFETNANTTLMTSATFVALHDYYIDNMHYNATVDKSGNYGTAPNLSSETKGSECTGLHYKFIGWIPESDMNMTTGVPTSTANMVAGGATGKYATGTNYYAIWAEEE